MGRGIQRRAVAVAAAVVCLGFTSATASAETTGTITGAAINEGGDVVSVSNFRLHFDSCGGYDDFAGLTGCNGIGGVVPATETCPTGAVGLIEMWHPGDTVRISNREVTLNSGEVSVAVPEPVAYRVCLYSYLNSASSRGPAYLRADTVTPAPPELLEQDALDAAKAALARRFGKAYRKGKRKKIDCIERSPNNYRCKVSWTHRRRAYKGKVIVSGPPSSPATEVAVKSKKKRKK